MTRAKNLSALAVLIALLWVLDARPLTAQETASDPAAEVSQLRRVVADLNVKIAALEREIRTLTGRLEESEYARRQLADDVSALRSQMADLVVKQSQMDERLATIANATPPASAGTGSSQQTATPAPTTETEDPAAPKVQLPDASPAEQFDYAYGFINKADLPSARVALEAFIEANPDNALTPNAIFWLGRVHLVEGRPASAASSFLQVIDSHSDHPKYAESLLDLAQALIALESKDDACNALADYRAQTDVDNPRLARKESRLLKEAGC